MEGMEEKPYVFGDFFMAIQMKFKPLMFGN
jgi:hypothetical protein